MDFWSVVLVSFYCLLIVGSSLLGGWLPTLIRITHVRMQFILSFVGGFMLGVGLLHLLPHSFEGTKDIQTVVISAMAGLLVIYLLLRTFDFHQHAPAEDGTDHADHHCDHPHHEHSPSGVWWSMVIGMSIHALVEGVALGASLQADSGHGLAVCLAILLHKPLDSMSVIALLSGAGQPKQKCMLINVMFAMLCPVGAALTILFVSVSPNDAAANQWWLGVALGFSAGTFLCISLSDLLPEVQFHRHDKVGLSAAMLLGVALAYGIGFVESQTHTHGEHSAVEESCPDNLPEQVGSTPSVCARCKRTSIDLALSS